MNGSATPFGFGTFTSTFKLTTVLFFNISTTPTSSFNGTKHNFSTTTAPNSEETPILSFLTKFVCVFVLIVGVFGNSLVLIVFGVRWSKLKTCEIFMISLALADLIGTIVVPCKLLLELMNYSFHPIGHGGCQFISFLSITSLTVSALTLVVISIDRYIIVKWPLRERPFTWKVCVIIFATWLLASGVGFVYFVPGNIKLHLTSPQMYFCRSFLNDLEYRVHVLITSCVQIVIPLVIITVVYSLIVLELRKGAKSELFKIHTREMQMRLKQNRRATQLLIVIVVVFYICVLPLSIFFIFYIFGTLNEPDKMTLHLFAFLQMFQMLNSCANPIIYSRLHRSFRRTILNLLCSCFVSKFKSYTWDSFRDSLRTAMLKSLRYKKKKSSHTSVTSTNTNRLSIGTPTSLTEHMFIRTKSLTDEMNHGKKIDLCRHLYNMGNHSPGNLSIRTSASEFDDIPIREADSPPIYSGRLSLHDDEVFSEETITLKDIPKRSKNKGILQRQHVTEGEIELVGENTLLMNETNQETTL